MACSGSDKYNNNHSSSSSRSNSNSNKWRLWHSLCLLTVLTIAVKFSSASQDVLPQPCDTVKCPPMDKITCPDDSYVRDPLPPIALLQAITTAPLAEAFNTSEIADELYAQCCLAKKCVCKTCYIPDCHNEDEVVIELLPESMETPGQCCGQYECQREPNCTEVRDMDAYWLRDCQRCKCYSGSRICHQSCDEGTMKKATAICNSKTLNTFFQHGESWKDGCYECECVNGEEKCVMPMCRSVNCPTHRQVILKDKCCPICWPKGIPMPNGDEEYEDENENSDGDGDGDGDGDDDNAGGEDDGILDNRHYDDNDDPLPPLPTDEYSENEIEPLPTLKSDANASTTTLNTTPKMITIVGATTKTTTSMATVVNASSSSSPSAKSKPVTTDGLPNTTNATFTTASPCSRSRGSDAPPATYQVYPERVEVVRQSEQNYILYGIISFLIIVIAGLIYLHCQLRNKLRSYYPVSNIDDNFNKMSSNIKKMNDYV